MRKKTRRELNSLKEDNKAMWKQIQEIALAADLIWLPAKPEQPPKYVKRTSPGAKKYVEAQKVQQEQLLTYAKMTQGQPIYAVPGSGQYGF